jgi:hypothetical protein
VVEEKGVSGQLRPTESAASSLGKCKTHRDFFNAGVKRPKSTETGPVEMMPYSGAHATGSAAAPNPLALACRGLLLLLLIS